MSSKIDNKKNVSFPNVKEMSKTELTEALIKKKISDARAIEIVKRLIDNPVPVHWFVYSCQYINKNHFDDIIEERAISNLCGYPICEGILGTVPQQKYIISTKTNQVHDITERKNFCSNKCYKAALFLKAQLLTSPLWLRDKEQIPNFQLLPNNAKGVPGIEVDFGLTKLEENPTFVSAAEFTECYKDDLQFSDEPLIPHIDISEHEDDTKETKADSSVTNHNRGISLEEKIDTVETNVGTLNLSKINISSETKSIESSTNPVVALDEIFGTLSLSNSGDAKSSVPPIITPPDKIISTNSRIIGCDKKSTSTKIERTQESSRKSQVNILKNTIAQIKARSLESQLRKVKLINYDVLPPIKKLTERNTVEHLKETNTNENTKQTSSTVRRNDTTETPMVRIATEPSISTPELLVQHVEFCFKEWISIETLVYLYGEKKIVEKAKSKLDIQRFTSNAKSSNRKETPQYERPCNKSDKKRVLQPLPDYNLLKEQNTVLDLKVKSFYGGNLEIEKPTEEIPESTVLNVESSVIPVVDKHSQNAQRRKIVLQYFNKTIPYLLQTFGLKTEDLDINIRGLVETFHLTAKNISFRPSHLNLLGLVFLKISAENHEGLKNLFDQNTTMQSISLLLSNYKLPHNYFDLFLKKVINIDRIINSETVAQIVYESRDTQ